MTMIEQPLSAAVAAAVLLMAAGAASALDITMPAETARYRASELPGFQLVQRNCMTCHAAQYVASQPPGSPRSYWEATVRKMKKPFGAQFADEDIPAMVDYLARTYGAERTAAALSAPVEVIKPAPVMPAVPLRDVQAMLSANGCVACHSVEQRIVGPAFKEVAARYAGKADAVDQIARSIRAGGAGKWGPVPMPPFGELSEGEAQILARYVLGK